MGALILFPIGHGFPGLFAKGMLSFSLSLAFPAAPGAGELSLVPHFYGFLRGVVSTLPWVVMIYGCSGIADLIEAGRGMTIGQVINPQLDQPESAFAQLVRWSALAWVSSHGALIHCLARVIESARRPESGEGFAGIDPQFLLSIVAQFINLLSAAVPMLVAFLLIGSFMSVAGRILPGVSLAGEQFMLKTALLLTILAANLTSGFDRWLSPFLERAVGLVDVR